MIKTEKIYYDDLYLTTCIATVVEVSEKGIVCNQTVSFPYEEDNRQIKDVF